MEFRILGSLEVVLDEGRAVPLERRRLRAVLAFLLLRANEPVPADRLIDEIWGPEPPKTAAASLQNHVSQLRKVVGRDALTSEPGGYVLRVDPERFDLARFRRLVADARRTSDPRGRGQRLEAALALWRGPPLQDLTFEAFAQPEIRRLEEERLEALEDRIQADLDSGGGARLVGEVEALVAQHPLRERLRELLMRALYADGRQADALDAYREARLMLRDELGLEPSDELRALERAILSHDPALRAVSADVPARPDSRRTVSVLFCDLVGSTRLAHRLDPEAYRALMTRYLEAVRFAIERHGGTVEKFIGDAVMAVFGAPQLHEDDALRAVRAAVDARAAVAEVDEALAAEPDVRLAVRIAVNSGEVVVVPAGADLTVTGVAVSVAAHLEEAAPDGAIVLGEETYRLVRHAVSAERLQLDDELHGWRLDDLIPEAPALDRRDDAPLIGRELELQALRAAFDAACTDERCRVVTVVGEAGIGKTRLARELAAAVRPGARVMVGRCVSYGEGATYLPLAEIVRQAAAEPSPTGIAALLFGEEDAEQVARRVAELTGLAEGPAAPGEAFWAVRRLVEALARERPLLLVLDDVHWAEPTLLDLVEYLGEWAEGPILVLCLARRDLLETRPAWSGPTSTGFLVEVEPLPARAAAELVAELTDEPVPTELREQIAEHSGGNPLFAQQLVALAREAPDVSLDTAPPSVEALIGGRLDRLDARELGLIRRAAVVGRRFSYDELADLSLDESPEHPLAELERRRLVHRTTDVELYRFHHVLIRDVAYRGIPKAERATLHELAGESLNRRDGADELIGYHFEQAYRYVTELARPDEHAEALALAGGEHLGRAGIRAWKRADAPAAVNLLGRAAELLPAGDETRRELLCELGTALRMRGELGRAADVLESAVHAAAAAQDERLRLRAALELANVRTWADPDSAAELLEIAATAIPVFERYEDHRSLGRAWLCIGTVRGGLFCDHAVWEEAATRAADHYRKAGWSPSTCLAGIASALLYGPTAAPEAVRRCDELLRDQVEDRAGEANVRLWMAPLLAMDRRFDDARASLARAKQIFGELGQTVATEDSCGSIEGAIELLAGRPEAAVAALERSCQTCLRLDEPGMLASRSAELAEALYACGRYDEAGEWARVAEASAKREDVSAEAAWRTVAAKLRAREGNLQEAEELARQAVDLVSETDSLSERAQATVALAIVVAALGRQEEAEGLRLRAEELYLQKGNLPAAEHARSLAQLAPTPIP